MIFYGHKKGPLSTKQVSVGQCGKFELPENEVTSK